MISITLLFPVGWEPIPGGNYKRFTKNTVVSDDPTFGNYCFQDSKVLIVYWLWFGINITYSRIIEKEKHGN
jgi:hypothetical protein